MRAGWVDPDRARLIRTEQGHWVSLVIFTANLVGLRTQGCEAQVRFVGHFLAFIEDPYIDLAYLGEHPSVFPRIKFEVAHQTKHRRVMLNGVPDPSDLFETYIFELTSGIN